MSEPVDSVGLRQDWTWWVSAAPFRAWLAHLCAATGFEPLAVAVAAGMPTSVARSLCSSNNRPRRIRSVDARALMAIDIETLRERGRVLADATMAQKALSELGPWRPNAEYLAKRLSINTDTAAGLADGWLDVCPQSVTWRCVALAQDITHTRTKAALQAKQTAVQDDVEVVMRRAA